MESSGVAGCSKEEKLSAEQYTENLIHHVRWVHWKGRRVPVVTQNENGPCPLVAISNLLLMRGDLSLPTDAEVVAATKLINMIGDLLFQRGMQQEKSNNRLDNEQNVYDAMTVLPRLSTGLDVNVKFDGVLDFEYTPECIIFDLLNITLCHGWLSDPADEQMHNVVSVLSYNQLVELIVVPDLSKTEKGHLAAAFHDASASQLTEWGLCKLRDSLVDGQLAVFFRNNHFSVVTKHQQRLYLLVTDQGFLKEEHYVWESLDKIDGDSVFVDSHFKQAQPKKCEPPPASLAGVDERAVDKQIENDLLLALSLEEAESCKVDDAEPDDRLAVQLHDEEVAVAQGQRQQSNALLPKLSRCTIM